MAWYREGNSLSLSRRECLEVKKINNVLKARLLYIYQEVIAQLNSRHMVLRT